MKKLLTILGIVLLACIGIYWFVKRVNTETITQQALTINGCTANYIHFKHDNAKKIAETGGHAPNNIIELGSAKITVAKCLCDKYLDTKTASDSIEIIHILNSKEYQHVKDFFESSLEDFQTDTLHLESVCKNKNKYFGKFLLD